MICYDSEARHHIIAASDIFKSGQHANCAPDVIKGITDGTAFRTRHICKKAKLEEEEDIRVAIMLYYDDLEVRCAALCWRGVAWRGVRVRLHLHLHSHLHSHSHLHLPGSESFGCVSRLAQAAYATAES